MERLEKGLSKVSVNSDGDAANKASKQVSKDTEGSYNLVSPMEIDSVHDALQTEIDNSGNQVRNNIIGGIDVCDQIVAIDKIVSEALDDDTGLLLDLSDVDQTEIKGASDNDQTLGSDCYMEMSEQSEKNKEVVARKTTTSSSSSSSANTLLDQSQIIEAQIEKLQCTRDFLPFKKTDKLSESPGELFSSSHEDARTHYKKNHLQ